MKKAIFMYDVTGLMAQPWLEAGYECWLFDGQHSPGITREGNLVKVGIWFYGVGLEYQAAMIRDIVGPGVELVFGFPECTYLTSAGARWFYHPEDKHLPVTERRPHPLYPDRRQKQEEAVELAKLVEHVGKVCDAPWAAENPGGSLSTLWRRFNHRFDPCDYAGYLPADDEHPLYPEVYPSQDRYNKGTFIWCSEDFCMPEKLRIDPIHKENPGWKNCGGRSKRTKNIRSATPRGFARAVCAANRKSPARQAA